VGGQDFRQHRLRNGDVIELGSFALRFQLTPIRRRPLIGWSTLLWTLLAAMGLIQIACVLWLAES